MRHPTAFYSGTRRPNYRRKARRVHHLTNGQQPTIPPLVSVLFSVTAWGGSWCRPEAEPSVRRHDLASHPRPLGPPIPTHWEGAAPISSPCARTAPEHRLPADCSSWFVEAGAGRHSGLCFILVLGALVYRAPVSWVVTVASVSSSLYRRLYCGLRVIVGRHSRLYRGSPFLSVSWVALGVLFCLLSFAC